MPRFPPTPVVRTATTLRSRVRRATDALLPSEGIAVERTLALLEVKLLAVACDLGVSDALAAAGRHGLDAPALAGKLRSDPDATERVLRFLAGRGWFRRDPSGRYRLTRRSRALVDRGAGSLRDWVRFMGADWHWDLWGHVGTAVRDGGSAARAATGDDFFSWIHGPGREDAARLFDGAMWSLSSLAGPLVADAVDLTGVRTVCDVGGGTGRTLRSILEAASHVQGVVFDLPDVVAGAPAVLGDLPADRWRAEGGDFFTAVPAGHDRYVLQGVLHDWGDEPARQILGSVRAALPPTGRVLVVENRLEPGAPDSIAGAIDALMLVLTEGGRERTQAEFERLFAAGGFAMEAQQQLPLLLWVFTLAPR